jgi:TonB family protein
MAMRTLSQLLLTFLVNAGWQLALIAAVTSICSWLLRNAAARQRHPLWVVALLMSFGLPWFGSQLLGHSVFSPASPTSTPAAVPETSPLEPINFAARSLEPREATISQNEARPVLRVNEKLATMLVLLYLLFLVYRSVKLAQAWQLTRKIRSSARVIEVNEQLAAIIDRCRLAIGVNDFEVRSSTEISVPVTVGTRQPLVILPDQLLREPDADVLTSAIGHELVHILRRDYLLNVVYELLFLPLSFHPAAALVRRRINQTRELSCDELVTEKLLTAEVYAHSLVQLAGSAMPFGRKGTLTVGITDADILEVRIMSLLKRSRVDGRRAKLLQVAASVLLAVPCMAAAAFAMSFDIAGHDITGHNPMVDEKPAGSQEKLRAKAIYKAEPEYPEDARANKIEGTVGLTASISPAGVVQNVQVTKPLYPSLDRSAVAAMQKWRFAPLIRDGQSAGQRIDVEMVFNMNAWQQDAQQREKRAQEELKRRASETEEVLKRMEEERMRQGEMDEREMKERAERDPQFKAELEARWRHQQEERKATLIAQAMLARTAKISIEQAIQIANSQYPGKVMECSLTGQGWEAPGKPGGGGRVLYHVIIISADESNPTMTHVLVNALDGTILKTWKDEQPQQSLREPISGGVLNAKAIALPFPEYPLMARAAGISGMVKVGVTVDEQGNVIEARALSGHPLLQSASVDAARQAKFSPTRLTGEPVKVSGILTYSFEAQ